MWAVYKRNWKEALGVLISAAGQTAFFPGIMLGIQWHFIKNYSYFVVTLVTYASVCDFGGKFLARNGSKLAPKQYFLLSCMVRTVMLSAICLLTYFGVYLTIFGADWWMVMGLFFFAGTFGFWITLGFKYGADESTGD